MKKGNPDISFIWKFGWPVLVLLLVWGIQSLGPGSGGGAGESLYIAHCANCHMEDGAGLAKLIPPLAQADFVLEEGDKLACIIRNGMKGPIAVNGVIYNFAMPANASLRPVEIAAIINYIRTAWENGSTELPFSMVEENLKTCN